MSSNGAKCRLAVFDLDGTLVNGNTLHIYFRCGALRLLGQGRIFDFIKLAGLIALRSVRLISHRSMKFRGLGLVHPDDVLKKRFVDKVSTRINHNVVDLVNKSRTKGMTVLLATAAPDVYVPWIWDSDYIATPVVGNPGRMETRGEEKLKRVMEYATANDLVPTLFVTDHKDDMPLITSGIPEVYIVGRDGRTHSYCK